MKKIVILMLISIYSVKSMAGVVESAKEMVDSAKVTVASSIKAVDTSSTFKAVYQDVKAGIIGLASALKVGAEHVYVVMVKQQLVNSISWTIVGILSFIFLAVWFKKYKSDEVWSEGDVVSGLGVLRLIQVICSLIGVILFIFHINSIMMGFINPEYGAIQDILNFIK